MVIRNIATGRDLLNMLKEMKDLNKPIEVSVFHHPHNDNEMPAIFGVRCIDEAHNILITCTDVHIPGTVDELTKDIEYKTMLTLNDDKSIDIETIKKVNNGE